MYTCQRKYNTVLKHYEYHHAIMNGNNHYQNTPRKTGQKNPVPKHR